MIPDTALSWRQRLVQIRGVTITALALLFLMLSRKLAIGLPDILVAGLLALLIIPSLPVFFTRSLPELWQQRLLQTELLLDGLLFMLFLNWSGGASNPLSFYLLLPILLSALSCPIWVTAALWLASMFVLRLPGAEQHAALPGAPVHPMTHSVDPLHATGMWLIFVLLGLVLAVLGHSLQRQRQQMLAWSRTRLEVALQRERMYDTAATQAHLAHEINTPLASLLWTIEDLSESASNEKQKALVEQLEGCANRIREALTRGAEDDLPGQPCDQETWINWVNERLRLLNPAFTISLADNSLRPSLSDTRSWSRIFLNLAYNANDAGASRLICRWQRQGNGWLLQVSDDGPALTESRPDRAGLGAGLGVGMALVESALAHLGGELSRSHTAQWTTVTLSLPDSRGVIDDD